MAQSAQSYALFAAGCLVALFLSPIAYAQTQTEVETCSLGSQGADATGNDCGSIERIVLAHHATHHVHKPLLLRVSAAPTPPKQPAVTAAKQPPEAPRLEAENDCATGASGVDATGNECNSPASSR